MDDIKKVLGFYEHESTLESMYHIFYWGIMYGICVGEMANTCKEPIGGTILTILSGLAFIRMLTIAKKRNHI